VIASPFIRKSASFAYAGIRVPFALVESRLPESSRIRTGLHAALQAVDASVEQLLNPAPAAAERDAGPAAASPDLDAEREAVAEAVREQQPDVGELADPELDVAEVQARLQAKHAIEARDEAR
jgi:hypothetical protein